MPTTIPVDDELDPTEVADQEDIQGEEELAVLEADAEPVADPDAEIVAEIDKVVVEEDEAPSAKQKAHMIPRHLIDAPLTPDDWFDNDGTI